MKVAFVYQQKASFVATDLQILTRHHNVDGVRFRGRRDIVRLWYAVADSDISFCWFGKLHAVFAVLFSKLCGRKSIVVAGGDDVANEPAIPYGLFAHPIKRWFALFIFRHADLILAMSDYSRSQVIQHAEPDPSKVRRAYLGFDHRRIQRLPGMNKGGVILTVGAVRSENLARKGLELFVRTAPLLPSERFVVVGPWLDDSIQQLRGIASCNTEFTGEITTRALLRQFGAARVYVQPSLHEGFGSSVAEAMLCECVPVVSRRAALPEVVGDCGLYVDELTPQALAARIEEASALGPEWGRRARQRAIDLFPLEKRRDALLLAIDEVMNH